MAVEQLLSVKECAEALGVTHWTVSRFIKRGELSCIRVGRRVLIAPNDLRIFLESRRVAAAPEKSPLGGTHD